MVKKRYPRLNSRSQITIFMILGLIILFVAMFMLQLSYSAKKGEIDSKQAEIVKQLFQKEGIRLYIQDCLSDPVQEGLNLLAKQGTIWQDQGGRIPFDPPRNGLLIPGETAAEGGRVLYGISNKEYTTHDEAYPCSTDENAPEFCQYIFPSSTTFGKKESLSINTLKKDLKSYIAKETTLCIDQFALIENLPVPELKALEIEKNMEIILNDDLIAVKINSPIKITRGEQELFSLSSFDAIYPTNFVKFFKTYIDIPIRYDVQYLDFQFGPTSSDINQKTFTVGRKNFIQNSNCNNVTLAQKEYFQCTILGGKYAGQLQPELTIENVNNGDELITISSGQHQLRFLRQNRPPALDYVNQSSCPSAGYDFLIIPDEPTLNTINLNLFSLDPDEDDVEFEYEYSSLGLQPSIEDPTGTLTFDTLPPESSIPYEITITAKDEHGLTDQQQVRILVDRPLAMDLQLRLPYNDLIWEQGGALYLSNEDPVFIEITWPAESLAASSPADPLFQSQVILNYTTEDNPENILLALPQSNAASTDCFSLPWTNSHTNCNLDDYQTDIDRWKISTSGPGDHFALETLTGKLELSFNMNYCGTFNAEKEISKPVVVKGCAPHKNPQYPFAYPYHQYRFENGVFVGKDINPINPLNSTHSCCLGDPTLPNTWKVAPDTEICFTDPEPQCAGKIQDYTTISSNKGYILEQQQTYCDGTRGNICQGIKEGELYQGKLTCGADLSCNKVHPTCKDVLAWGYAPDNFGNNIGWCNGQMGCQDICTTKPVVDLLGKSQLPNFVTINTLALEDPLLPDKNDDLGFECGCVVGKLCDSNYDGQFTGTCQPDGSCSE